MHKGSNMKLRKLYDTKARKTNSIKVPQEVMTIMEKQDLRQNLYGFKKENTQTYDRQNKENSKKTQISLKQNRKLQEIKELLKLMCNTTQNLNKNTPKLMIPHDMIPIAQFE